MEMLQSWVPTLVIVVGLIAQAVMMREQVKALTREGKTLARELKNIEAKLDAIIPRIGELDRLRSDVDKLEALLEDMRDAMLRTGDLQPARATRGRSRTPARPLPLPAPPVSRESDED